MADKKLTISSLFENLNKDVHSLINFNICSTISSSRFPFSSTKKGNQYYINYSKDAGDAEINDIQEFFEYLFIYCHELAHCLNKHNGYRTDVILKDCALETMADHQGTLIAMSIYTYGKNINEILIQNFNCNKNTKYNESLFCQNVAGALEKLYFDFYKENRSRKYLPAGKRIVTHIMGIGSFFQRNRKFLSFKEQYIAIMAKIIVNLNDTIIDIRDMPSMEEVITEIKVTHQEIQGDKKQITEIKNPLLVSSFGTSYKGTMPLFLKNRIEQEIQDALKKLK